MSRYILVDRKPVRVSHAAYLAHERALDADFEDWCRTNRVGHWEEGDVRVSTTFLGIDVSTVWSRNENGGPVLFESMVFGGPFNGQQIRYRTWDEAEAGHAQLVARVQAAQKGTTP